MKKLILLLLIGAGLTACKNDKKASDSLAQYLSVYDGLTANKDVALDPFMIAYRLHLYRIGGATQALKSELFPHAEITESTDGQSVVLKYTEASAQPADDFIRSGEVVIHTGGKALSEEGALWRVTANNAKSVYRVLYPGMDYWSLGIDRDEYLISNAGANRFRVEAGIYMISNYLGTAWNWDLNLIVTRTQGSDSGWSGTRLEIEAADAPAAGGGFNVNYSARYRYEILSPVLYNTDCGYLIHSGGQERYVRTDLKDYKGLDSLVVDFGQNYNSCTPAFTFSVRAETDESWTTHHYGPNGEWLD